MTSERFRLRLAYIPGFIIEAWYAHLVVCFTWFNAWIAIPALKIEAICSPKRMLNSVTLHSVISQTTEPPIVITVRNMTPTFVQYLLSVVASRLLEALLQAGRWRVRFPLRSVGSSIVLISPAALCPRGRLRL
jgi:hypothetical protein